MASVTSRRVRAALVIAVLRAPAVGVAAPPVYIWRDANGVLRFTAPPPAPAPLPR